MSKILGVFALAVVVFLLVLGGWLVSTNHALVTLDEGVKQKWAQVENVYQRRADLIPNLVNTVKGYAKHEKTVFENVTKARSSLLQANTIKDKAKSDNIL